MIPTREPGEIVTGPRLDAQPATDVSSERLRADMKTVALGVGALAGAFVLGFSVANSRSRRRRRWRFAPRRRESAGRVFLTSLGRLVLQKGLDHLLSGGMRRTSMGGESGADV